MEQNKVPQSFLCCISHNIMNDPWMDPEGNSYEKSQIERWLGMNQTSPITRTPLSIDMLRPNRALKDAIETFKRGYNKPSISEVSSGNSTDMTGIIPKCFSDNNLLMIEVDNPNGATRMNIDLALVLDVSGSMQSEAKIKNSSGQNESYGLCLLDIVKHAAKTIIKCLGSGDRLTIISYSTNAKVELPLTIMDDANKEEAISRIKSLQPDASTNIWDALNVGMNILDSNKGPNQRCLFLLTDGQPNISPPRGEVEMLKRFKDSHPNCCNINTYGFGYGVNSTLLSQLAEFGEGGYYMIPDSGFVGTIFEHSFANITTSFTSIVKLSIENIGGNKIISTGNTYKVLDLEWGKQITFSPLQFGQTKNFVIEFEKPLVNQQVTVFLDFIDYRDNKPFKIELKNQQTTLDSINLHYLRSQIKPVIGNIIEILKVNPENLAQAQEILGKYVKMIKTYLVVFPDHYLSDFLKDLAGQTTLAISSEEYYNRWGCHYLPSLMLAHMNQQCNNFKDPGVQHFGGELFKKIRDYADEIFCSLPPPTPSVRNRGYSFRSASLAGSASAAPRNFTMATYSNSAGPCFHGNSVVTMFDDTKKKVYKIKKGDMIKTASGKVGTIRCVVKTPIKGGKLPMVGFESGLLITKYHPMMINSIWVFPVTVGETQVVTCDAIYSFILDEGCEPVMIINSMECITLAHNLTGPVVSHPYYGTNKIIDDMMLKDGWEKGLVILDNPIFQRDPSTKMVEAII